MHAWGEDSNDSSAGMLRKGCALSLLYTCPCGWLWLEQVQSSFSETPPQAMLPFSKLPDVFFQAVLMFSGNVAQRCWVRYLPELDRCKLWEEKVPVICSFHI